MKLLMLCFGVLFFATSYSQTLTIGSSRFNPPFEIWASQSSVHYGFDFDLMTEICIVF